MTQTNQVTSISMEQARHLAPAIFADSPAYYTTERYKFTPTTEVIANMQSLGWQLTNAKQSRTKIPLRLTHGIHIVEFQHEGCYIKDADGRTEARPTIMLLNSHDGTKPLNFEMGIFRLICSNGLVVKSKDFGGFKERHTKYTIQQLQSLMNEKMQGLRSTVDKINRWVGIEMSVKQRRQFATDALSLRISSNRKPEDYEIMDVLQPKRKEDEPNTLWHVMNRVQENLIKGGFQFNNRQARPITNPLQDMVLNQGIWQIADSYAA